MHLGFITSLLWLAAGFGYSGFDAGRIEGIIHTPASALLATPVVSTLNTHTSPRWATPRATTADTFCSELLVASPTKRPATLTNLFEKDVPKLAFEDYRTIPVAASMITGGVFLMAVDKNVRTLRNNYLPIFRYHYDDYLQYSPAALMLGLKVAGMEGRSSWGRMAVSDAFSAIIMAAVVNTLKYSVRVGRPDGSSRNSFPSGHTATAFITATMLHKEYGLTRSPWYSTAGYTLATATALSRIMNNKHWLSDVLVGAGVGILSAELGYHFADLLFKQRGVVRTINPPRFRYDELRPSFVGLGLGGVVLTGDMDDYQYVKRGGMGIRLEGAWFMTHHFGIGSEWELQHVSTIVERQISEKYASSEGENTRYNKLQAGFYSSIPLSNRWLAGGRLVGGLKYNSKGTTKLVDQNGDVAATIAMDYTPMFTATVGASLRYLLNNNLGVRLALDYNYMRHKSTFTPVEGTAERFDNFVFPITATLAVDVMLW